MKNKLYILLDSLTRSFPIYAPATSVSTTFFSPTFSLAIGSLDVYTGRLQNEGRLRWQTAATSGTTSRSRRPRVLGHTLTTFPHRTTRTLSIPHTTTV